MAASSTLTSYSKFVAIQTVDIPISRKWPPRELTIPILLGIKNVLITVGLPSTLSMSWAGTISGTTCCMLLSIIGSGVFLTRRSSLSVKSFVCPIGLVREKPGRSILVTFVNPASLSVFITSAAKLFVSLSAASTSTLIGILGMFSHNFMNAASCFKVICLGFILNLHASISRFEEMYESPKASNSTAREITKSHANMALYRVFTSSAVTFFSRRLLVFDRLNLSENLWCSAQASNPQKTTTPKMLQNSTENQIGSQAGEVSDSQMEVMERYRFYLGVGMVVAGFALLIWASLMLWLQIKKW